MNTKLEEAFEKWIKVQRTSVLHRKDCEDEYEQVFTAGAEFMQKNLLKSVSEGFDEWFTIFYKATPFDNYNESIPVNAQDLTRWQKEAWQACELKNQKIIQEKDEEIKRLKDLCEAYESDLGMREAIGKYKG